MKHTILAGIAAAALAVPMVAQAADMPVKAPIYKAEPVAVYSWTGCYIGANVGGIKGNDRLFTHPGPPGSFGGAVFNPSPNSHTYKGDDSSVTGGGQVGCNWQSNRFVFGVEADINGTGLRSTETAAYPDIVQTAPSPTTWTAHNETVTSKLPWYSTFRGRAGIAVGERSFIYATGGFVVGKVNASLNYVSTTAPFTLTGSSTSTRTGWTVGGGWEWAWSGNWSVKAEYLYIDFNSFSFLAPNVVPGAGDLRTWALDVRAREHVARVGLNYHFGGPVVARY